LAVLIDQDVARLQIAMDQAALMRVMQRLRNSRHDLETLPDAELVPFDLSRGMIPSMNSITK
jgi:hypothetical protein